MKRLMLALLRGYKLVLSPAIRTLGIRCRYDPDCANYGIEAITRHGAWAGGWMTLARLQRCHPIAFLGGSSGVDNVPPLHDKPPADIPWWTPWKYGVWRHRTERPSAESPTHADPDLP